MLVFDGVFSSLSFLKLLVICTFYLCFSSSDSFRGNCYVILAQKRPCSALGSAGILKYERIKISPVQLTENLSVITALQT